ncbi:MAG: hypothetical protein V3U56_16485 [Syntrophobacteria bacterium]
MIQQAAARGHPSSPYGLRRDKEVGDHPSSPYGLRRDKEVGGQPPSPHGFGAPRRAEVRGQRKEERDYPVGAASSS